MNMDVVAIKKKIRKSVQELARTQQFATWLTRENPKDGDLVIFNNSFVYRKPLVKTSKNAQYLALEVKNGKPDLANLLITKPGEMNSDFKLFSAKSQNSPPRESLDLALQSELKQLGRLVFVLIGELQDVPTAVPVNHSDVKELKLDPSARNQALVEDAETGNKTIVVKKLTDPESVWNAVKPNLAKRADDDLSSLETAFGAAFEKLQNEARMKLLLPSPTAQKTAASFIARMRKSVSKQRSLYEAALREWASGGDATGGHLREAMRIAYNFADDAIKVLQLLVSVADLKAVVLWCTIKEHFDIAEAFRNLPWTKSHKKPSLERYREIISGARNRAFHNLLAFDRTIEADLGGVDVKARRLTLLRAHGRQKNTVPFDYEDRELVEILTELTRAPEVAVPFNFWKKNAAVIESFERLLESTEDALWALNGAQR